MSRTLLAIALLVLLGAGAAAGAIVLHKGKRVVFADADDHALVAEGQQVYDARCAACHGAHLEGQPDWQHVNAQGRVPAPPQDETGHTWMHDDAELVRFVKYSVADIAAPGYVSDMPAFDHQLSDRQVLAVLAFIKSRWPRGVRVYQAMLNPGFAGLPSGGGEEDWRLPADCGSEPGRTPADSQESKQ
jgi:mono/diheme cytochrome c family protein